MHPIFGVHFVYSAPYITRERRIDYLFDYYYGEESEQFAYYRIPRLLITGSQFKNISTDAKLLYGLMLDRMCLSRKNGWLDNCGRVYIFYPLNEIQEALNCGHNKGVRLLAELDVGSGIGLIERIKQGQGNPTKIYVKRFTARSIPPLAPYAADHRRLPEIGTPDFPKEEVKTSDNGKPRLPDNGSADFRKPEVFYNRNSYLDKSYLYLSIHQSEIETIDRDRYAACIRENIGYTAFPAQHQQEVDELVMLMTDTLCSPQATFRIGGVQFKSQTVKERLISLEQPHIEYVLECMRNNTTKVRNIRGYLLTVLYNAPATMEHYYQSAVQHDLYRQQSEP